jgi:23S rRNA (adenine-N6)-dimethyltransferase
VAVPRRTRSGAVGQHFLRSSRLAAELVRAAGVTSGDVVVDVGAGTGVLTRALVDRGACVVAVELDAELAHALERRFHDEDVAVLQADAVNFEWPERSFSVVSNLPFSGSTPILTHLLRDPRRPLERAHVIVQWELAAKHVAVWPATLKGTYWRTWNEIAISDRLARTAFAPAPTVDAAVLRISPLLEPTLDRNHHRQYWRFLARAFHVRAPLTPALRPYFSRAELRRLADTHAFAPEAHARDLDVRQWTALFRWAQQRKRLA